MDEFKSAESQLRDAILEAADVESLRILRLRIVQIDSARRSVTPYERKRINSAVADLFKLADSKLSLLSKHTFLFVGDPGTPSTDTAPAPVDSECHVKILPLTYKDLHCVKQTVVSDRSHHCLVSNVTDSIVSTGVDLQLASVNLSNVRNSVIRIACEGPIFVHDVRHLVLICSCHQLRLHNVEDLTVHVEKVSNDRLVLEHCDGLLVSFKHQKPVIDDFNWPRVSHDNPHFLYTDMDDYTWIYTVDDGPLNPPRKFPFTTS